MLRVEELMGPEEEKEWETRLFIREPQAINSTTFVNSIISIRPS